MLRALASAAIFSEGSDGRFSLTPLAEPLRSDAPDSLRAYAIMTGSEWFYNTWAQLPYSIRNGEPAFEHLHGKSVFEYLAENPAAAKIFDDGMTSLSKRERARMTSLGLPGSLMWVAGMERCCLPSSKNIRR